MPVLCVLVVNLLVQRELPLMFVSGISSARNIAPGHLGRDGVLEVEQSKLKQQAAWHWCASVFQGTLLMASFNPNLVRMLWKGTPLLGFLATLGGTQVHTNRQGHCRLASKPPAVWLSWMSSFWNRLPFFKSPLVSKKTLSSCFLGPSDPFPLQVWFQSSAAFSSLSASLALENLPHRHSLWPWVKELRNSSTDFPPFSWNFSIFSSRDSPSSSLGRANAALGFFISLGIFTAFGFAFGPFTRLSFTFGPFSRLPLHLALSQGLLLWICFSHQFLFFSKSPSA